MIRLGALEVWTIGHSTRTIEAFLEALRSFQIAHLADVRRFPASRRNPQYNVDDLKKSLFHAGIQYHYLGDELGGFRDSKPGSAHACLKGSGFQGYADYLYSPGYEEGISQVIALARQGRTCVLCAERHYKSCHRKILADDLLLTRGARVTNILDPGTAEPHVPTPTARVVDGKLLYAPVGLGEFASESPR